jgi:hypothetical protein
MNTFSAAENHSRLTGGQATCIVVHSWDGTCSDRRCPGACRSDITRSRSWIGHSTYQKMPWRVPVRHYLQQNVDWFLNIPEDALWRAGLTLPGAEFELAAQQTRRCPGAYRSDITRSRSWIGRSTDQKMPWRVSVRHYLQRNLDWPLNRPEDALRRAGLTLPGAEFELAAQQTRRCPMACRSNITWGRSWIGRSTDQKMSWRVPAQHYQDQKLDWSLNRPEDALARGPGAWRSDITWSTMWIGSSTYQMMALRGWHTANQVRV